LPGKVSMKKIVSKCFHSSHILTTSCLLERDDSFIIHYALSLSLSHSHAIFHRWTPATLTRLFWIALLEMILSTANSCGSNSSRKSTSPVFVLLGTWHKLHAIWKLVSVWDVATR
jgi:hypothetical protein